MPMYLTGYNTLFLILTDKFLWTTFTTLQMSQWFKKKKKKKSGWKDLKKRGKAVDKQKMIKKRSKVMKKKVELR